MKTKPMTIAIVDDEIHCIETLDLHLKTLYPEASIVYKSNNPKDALVALPQINPDLLFLDVEMPAINGFELLDQLSSCSFGVIFTTAYSQYALQALKANAVDYLLKPIDEQELEVALEKWKSAKKINSDSISEKMHELLKYLKKDGMLKNKIAIPIPNGFEFVPVDDIMYCKGKSNYVSLYFVDGSNILLSKLLKEMENSLAPFFFLRVHQSYLINPNYLKKYIRRDGGYVVMKDGSKIPVSRQNKSLVMGLFESIEKKETKKN